MIRDDAENWRHQAGPNVSACHLNSDDSLRFVRSKIGRCCVDNAGVNRSASQSDDDKAKQRYGNWRREKQNENSK